MDNPFLYGEAVTGNNFCNRENDINKLKIDLMSSQKIFLISSRKIGKTSLISTVLEQLKKQSLIVVFMDLEGFASYKDFLDAYVLALMREVTTIDKILNFVRSILPGLRIEVKIDESGRPQITLGYSRNEPELNKIASKIYELPQIIAKRRKKKVVVVFDEFQEILKLDGQEIEGIMRAAIQHHRDAGYVFAGSKRHLLTDMVNSQDRPFYKIGPVMYLKKIPEEEFFPFIKTRFASTGVTISDRTVRKIIKTAENIPYYVQMLSHELWDYSILSKRVRERDIGIVMEQLISQYSQNFHLEWSRLILSKRRLLKAIASDGGANIFSKDFLIRNELGYPSAVRRTLLSLTEEGYLDRDDGKMYFITDLLFREWVKKL